MKLGVCYYPEHWPEADWAADARAMADMGLSWVRIAEFAWCRIEPEPGRFDWGWLDRAVETLAAAGLKIVMCTPTATPPKWLVDAHPDMLAVDARGQPRRFGSRRHYCFSSEAYRVECDRIVEAVAARYGRHPAVGAWQTDNEFGCHDTTISYSANAAHGFRLWLSQRYPSIDALNRAWGNVFWSQEYRSFEEVDPPFQTVTEANPSHRMDYNRFASDEVATFNRRQTKILRRLSPGRDITHNFMGFYTEFDHFHVGRDLDFASWDSYPLGFLEQFADSAEEKLRYARQGHPDISGFHHDLYRGCGRGRWWVMEQQPGPVNWARFNPAPLPGVVRTWSWEAFAHGAEVVSYFRWRQAPFGQEQFHAGLNRPDRVEDQGGLEARQVAIEIAALGPLAACDRAKVALVFSYEADWHLKIQPQGQGFSWLRLAFEMYGALRRRGLDVDILPPDADFTGYGLIVCPSLPMLDEATLAGLKASGAVVLFGPRTGSRTTDGQFPATLPPGPLQSVLPMRVVRVESLRPQIALGVCIGDQVLPARLWRETIETDLTPRAEFADGGPAWIAHPRLHYLATWPERALLDAVVVAVATEAGVELTDLPEGVRLRRRGGLTFALNFNSIPCEMPTSADDKFVLGGAMIEPGGLSVWR
jgi:beta-galactosidase